MKKVEIASAGPEYVLRVFDPKLNMRGFLVVDNTALGPGKGGIRMTASVTEEEVFRLARTMTWKNSIAGIPFGGAKAGIVWPGGPDSLKKEFVQSFARALKPFLIERYIAGPDVNTGEEEMKWFAAAAGDWSAATGKPGNYCVISKDGKSKKCGLPHELGSTGFGVAQATAVAAQVTGVPLKGAHVAIHGFGNVGTFAYRFLTEMGAKVVALADRRSAIYSPEGFDPRRIEAAVDSDKNLGELFPKEKIPPENFWHLPLDILIPASVTDVIHEGNKKLIRTKIIVEAGNIPMREAIEMEFFKKGIMVVPDFVANAGGVISSYAEYQGYSHKKMFETVKNKIVATTRRVLEESKKRKKEPREVAMEMAQERVMVAMKKRRRTFA